MPLKQKPMWVTSNGDAFEDKFVAAKHEANRILQEVTACVVDDPCIKNKLDKAIEAILANPKEVTEALVEYVEQYNLPRPAAQCPPVQPNPISPNHPDYRPGND